MIIKNKDYVTHDVAKLLKEKGYDGFDDFLVYYITKDCKCVGFWGFEKEFKEGQIIEPNDYNCYNIPKENMQKGVVELCDAQKWLREFYDLNIIVEFDNSQLWGWTLYQCNIDDKYVDTNSMFKTYEEALNAGIKKALEFI